MAFTTTKTTTSFGGTFHKLTHHSTTTKTPMNLTLFLPPTATPASPAPLLVYLSGLTCSPDNCTEKGFLHAHASPLGLALLYPDTSPRGTSHPGEHDDWDFGSAASFYLDATEEPWRENYNMESYLTGELPPLLFREYPQLDGGRVSITGHSMGGHGALTLFMRHPGVYKSVSALAPICNPSRCAWGIKAFGGYLGGGGDAREGDGEREKRWGQHDATELVRGWAGRRLDVLIDVGLADPFYQSGQLLPENFAKAAKEAGVEGPTIRYHEGYDHSYFFISTFGEDHVRFAAKALGLL